MTYTRHEGGGLTIRARFVDKGEGLQIVYVQGVRAKSTRFCNIDLSVFYETNMAINGSILFRILSAFRICPFLKLRRS